MARNITCTAWRRISYRWKPITTQAVDPNGGEQDLLLKESHNGLIEVLYDATHNDIGVWTYSSAQGWVRHGDYIPVTFNDGDQFGARALSNGDVEVYKNGVLLGVRDVSSWEYYAGGGRIGIWFVDVTGALLDDFGGGTLAGGEGLMAQGSSFIEDDSSDLLEKLQANPKPTRTPSPTETPTATQTPTPP